MKHKVLSKNNKAKVKDEAVSILKNGGLIIFPTETCYGVGVSAVDKKAVGKLLQYKRRPEGKAISVAVSDQNMAKRYVDLNEEAKNIYKEFLPGPVTVISNYKQGLASGLTSEANTLGIRIPDSDIVRDIISKLDSPITATSANSAGKKTPYSVADILDNISQKQKESIDLIIDAGTLPPNPPSTVIDTTKHTFQILRQGEVMMNVNLQFKVINSSEEMVQEGVNFVNANCESLEQECKVVLFNAELGAGKTQFVKGIAQALGIKEIVTSPTYIIIEEYKFNYKNNTGKLIHMDTWRLENDQEFLNLEIEKYIKPGNVIAVEWAGGVYDQFSKLNKKSDVRVFNIDITYHGFDKRKLAIYGHK